MGGEGGGPAPEVPEGLYEFYAHFRPFRAYGGGYVREFAPYQVGIWNDRFRDLRERVYVRSPGTGLARLLLLEALNVVLASRRRTDALVVVADQFAALRRRDEIVEMLEGSSYSGCLVRPEDQTDDMGTHAIRRRAGVVVRPPHAASDEEVCGITVESVIGFSASSTNMHHVLVLDALESGFPVDRVSWGMANALSTTALTGGRMVVAMVPRAPFYRLHERIPDINGLDPGAPYERRGTLVRRIPTSLAIDAGVIESRDDNVEEVELMGRPIRDAKYPVPVDGPR